MQKRLEKKHLILRNGKFLESGNIGHFAKAVVR